MRAFLRPCTAADADVLRELSVRTYYETFAHMNTPEDMEEYLARAFAPGKLRAELADGDSSFYFLYADERLAGYLKLNEAAAQTDVNDADALEIERIYVSAEHQGTGLGRYLMEQALAEAVRRNKRYVWLGVWEKNDKAIRFYERNGFYRIGNHPFVMGTDEQNDYVMRKDL